MWSNHLLRRLKEMIVGRRLILRNPVKSATFDYMGPNGCFIRGIRLISLLLPLFLLCAGMRVPDLSRPHKPKPLQRAVVETSSSRDTVKAAAKIDLPPFSPVAVFRIFVTDSVVPFVPLTCLPKSPLRLFAPLPPRAPPS